MSININDHKKNRGLELLLYKKGVHPKTDEEKKFSFRKIFSLFKREFHFFLELSIRNKK